MTSPGHWKRSKTSDRAVAKYRKKPVVVEAEQFFWNKEGMGWPAGMIFARPSAQEPKDTYILTLEGLMKVSDGDWIITGVDGEKSLCKPDIFEATHERVEEPGASVVEGL